MLPSATYRDRAPRIDAVKSELLREVLRAFDEARLRVSGSSMLPSVRPGDVLVIRREIPPQILPGEVVVFARGERLFAHRVVRKSCMAGQPLLITRGDALPHEDAPLSSGELLGRVVRVERAPRQVYLATRARLLLGRLPFCPWPPSRWWPALKGVMRRLFCLTGAAGSL